MISTRRPSDNTISDWYLPHATIDGRENGLDVLLLIWQFMIFVEPAAINCARPFIVPTQSCLGYPS